MDFNQSKCEILHITNKRNTINSEHNLHRVHLGVTKARTYLGDTISPNLTGSKHIVMAVKNANSPNPPS